MAKKNKNIAEFSSTDLKTINDIIRNWEKTEREQIFKEKCKNTQYHDGIISEVATRNGSVFDLKSVEEIETRYQEVLNDPRNKEKTKDDQKSAEGNYFPSSSIASYKDIIIKYAIAKSIEDKLKGISLTRQTIYYGSPGCGKSRKVKDILENIKEDYKFRTTFHPDSDYYSFVGAYKPQKDKNGITYDFISQVFTKAYIKAWINQCEPIFLIIEEINRGNCAQIFGDLFQLLDRDSNGYSEYPIDADEDLKQYLEEELDKNNEGIKEGKLKLPPNLYIIATMNTSDQSLFPMDSAFKRRWAWKHVPINYNSNGSKFDINIGNKSFPWNTFLKQINYKIYDVTKSEDKMLGNFFIKGDVDEEEFVEKVMFYLWNDVLKMEYATGNNSFFKYKTDGTEETFKFSDLFGENKSQILTGFMEYLEVKPKEDD